MIQRIQSLYLLAVVALCSYMLFADLITLTSVDYTAAATAWGLYTPDFEAYPFPLTGILLSLSAFFAFATILIYKSRRLQISLCFGIGVLLIGILLYEGYNIYQYQSLQSEIAASGAPTAIIDYHITALAAPLVALFFIYLAYRAIVKDIALLTSFDRIR